MSEGCYTCLKESLAVFEQHLHVKLLAGVHEKAFDAAVLIAIREKELGIPGDASMIRARQLGTPTSPPRNSNRRCRGLTYVIKVFPMLASENTEGTENRCLYANAA
ncbi:MAG: hypothetical protein ABI039_07155 [Vicinamibacterales bacterium]